MSVRNFWASVKTDAREVATGPRAKDGGIYVEVLMREHGAIASDSLTIEGIARSDGTLLLCGFFQGQQLFAIESER
jgi:hypothetical protein